MNINIYNLIIPIYSLYAFYIQKIKLNRISSGVVVLSVLMVAGLSPNYRDVLQLLLFFSIFFMASYQKYQQVNVSIQFSVMPLICVSLVNQIMFQFDLPALWIRIVLTLAFISIFTVIGQWVLNSFYHYKPRAKSTLFIAMLCLFFYIYYRQLMKLFAYLMAVEDSLLIMFQGVYLLIVLLFMMVLYFFHTSNENIRMVERDKADQAINQQYVDVMTRQYEEVRKFRHDYQNILIGLEGLIKAREWDALDEYFDQAWGSLQSASNDSQRQLEKLVYLQNADLRNLIYTKLLYAQSLSVTFKLEITESILIKTTDLMSLPRMLGIILDNAIEAASDIEESVVSIALIDEELETRIIVSNPYQSTLDAIHILRQEGYSTKGKGRGIGLYNLDLLVKKSNIMLQTELNDQVFTQELTILKEGI